MNKSEHPRMGSRDGDKEGTALAVAEVEETVAVLSDRHWVTDQS